MELKINIFSHFNHKKEVSCVDAAVTSAALLAENGIPCRIEIEVGNKGYGLSVVTLDPKVFEVAILKDGETLEDLEGEVERCLFRLGEEKLRAFLFQVEKATKVTTAGLWSALRCYTYGCTQQEALRLYKFFFVKEEEQPVPPEEQAYEVVINNLKAQGEANLSPNQLRKLRLLEDKLALMRQQRKSRRS